MSLLEKNLLPGEHIIHTTKYHKFLLIRDTIYPVVLVIIVAIFAFTELAKKTPYLDIIFAFLALLGFFRLLYVYFSYTSTNYAITNRRVMLESGIISKQISEMSLTKIELVEVEQSLLGRMLDYGTVIVRGTGGSGIFFHGIEKPFSFRNLLQEQIRQVQT